MNDLRLTKKDYTNRINYEPDFKNGYFDSFNPRKAAYGLTKDSILKNYSNNRTNIIKGDEKVRIYRKRNY